MSVDLSPIGEVVEEMAIALEGLWKDVVMGRRTVPGVDAPEGAMYWREKYADSIVQGERLMMAEAGKFRAVVVAASEVAWWMEDGKEPWDMKPMLLGGTKTKINADGKKYVTIPFRHRTPGGSADQHFANQMPRNIYQMAKRLSPGERLKGTEALHPPKLHFIGSSLKTGAALQKPIEYQHKSGLYEGMVKTGASGHSQYMTFRVVSESSSDPDSWWHPGFKALHIADALAAAVKPKFEERVMEVAAGILQDEINMVIGLSAGRG